jgi:hypothetical protein
MNIPADQFLIDGDHAWWLPTDDEFGDHVLIDTLRDEDRPCDTCLPDKPGWRLSGGNEWKLPDGRFVWHCDCIDGRHTFDLEVDRWAVGRRHGPKTITYRVAVLDVCKVVTVRYVGGIGIEWPDGRHANPPLPSAAAPGMFVVRLAVRA